MGTFSIAFAEMTMASAWYREPEPFNGYMAKHLLPARDTASSISVDSIKRLDPELREAGVMVLRLGTADRQRGTQFALVKAQNPDLSDFFFLDDTHFASSAPELFIPCVSYRTLFGFRLLPWLTETSLVNLAVFSGLLAHALGLDSSDSQPAPATGQSTFSFDVRPRASSSKSWRHNQGQVEVDSVFAGQRGGRPVVIIVESKAGDCLDSLAKHKLLYPYLALAPMLPEYMDTILVYLRAIQMRDGFHFYVAECAVQRENPSLDGLAVSRTRHLVLQL